MLSKIENGQISPSLSTLQMLAAALATPITTLFASPSERHDCCHVKAGQGIHTNRRGGKAGHHYQLIGKPLAGDVSVEPYLITLSKDAMPCVACQHPGGEFLYMLSGEMDYSHNRRTYHLKSGDSLMFDGSALHGPEKLIRAPLTYLSIILSVSR